MKKYLCLVILTINLFSCADSRLSRAEKISDLEISEPIKITEYDFEQNRNGDYSFLMHFTLLDPDKFYTENKSKVNALEKLELDDYNTLPLGIQSKVKFVENEILYENLSTTDLWHYLIIDKIENSVIVFEIKL